MQKYLIRVTVSLWYGISTPSYHCGTAQRFGTLYRPFGKSLVFSKFKISLVSIPMALKNAMFQGDFCCHHHTSFYDGPSAKLPNFVSDSTGVAFLYYRVLWIEFWGIESLKHTEHGNIRHTSPDKTMNTYLLIFLLPHFVNRQFLLGNKSTKTLPHKSTKQPGCVYSRPKKERNRDRPWNQQQIIGIAQKKKQISI